MDESTIICEEYYVKKVNNHEYFIACKVNSSNWVYYDIKTDKEKVYYVSQKNEKKLRPPK